MKTDRRRFLSGALLGAAGLALPQAVRAAPASFAATRLNDRLTVLATPGCNVLVGASGNETLMVDCGRAEDGKALETAVLGVTGGKPVQTLFNTHWHLDNTGANGVFAKSGATIVAHENTRLWMTTEFHVDWENRTYKPRQKIEQPTKTIYTKDTLPFAGEAVEYGHLPRAHTDGDIYVRFPKSNVIAVGGTVTDGEYPVLDYVTGGWLGDFADAQQRLLGMVDDDTIIIPARGRPLKKGDLDAQFKMMSALFDRLVELIYKGSGPRDLIAAHVTKDFDDRLKGDPAQFLTLAYWGMWGHVRELERIV